jgi:alcohol dehydrogenase class IV
MAYEGDVSAREGMALASLLSGLALANSGLGAVHGFAAPIGGFFNASHGAVCAALLSASLTVNISALTQRGKEHPAINKLKVIAQILTQKNDAEPKDLIEWIRNTCEWMKIRRLKDLGIEKENFSDLIEKAQNASSMKGNPIKLTDNELYEILQLSY